MLKDLMHCTLTTFHQPQNKPSMFVSIYIKWKESIGLREDVLLLIFVQLSNTE